MQELEIRAIDPGDTETFADAVALYDRADRFEAEDFSGPDGLGRARIMALEANPVERVHWFGGYTDGTLVSVGQLGLRFSDNTDRAWVVVHTAPEQRRQGHGGQLYSRLEAEALAQGRTVVDSEASWSLDLASDGTGSPGREFLLAQGFTQATWDVVRVADLRAEAHRLYRLEVESAPHHGAYTLRVWEGAVPDDIVESWLAVSGTIFTEAPTDLPGLENATVSVAAQRRLEQEYAAAGARVFNTVALAPDLEVAAYTDVWVYPDEPARGYQFGTLVAPPHRGHRLGTAIKVANHRQILAHAPAVTEIWTWNNEENSYMVDINVAMGFARRGRCGEFYKTLGEQPRGRVITDN